MTPTTIESYLVFASMIKHSGSRRTNRVKAEVEMPHTLNIVAGILCVLVGLFLGVKVINYLNLLAMPFKDAVASGVDLSQVKQFYALVRATTLFIGLGLIFFLGQWPALLTY